MKNFKLSFLIAAHNEEKIIGKTLSNLLKLPYKNYEIIIGLDGCTDKTEEIVKKYAKKNKKIKYYTFNLRQGKAAVINRIIKYAKGDIIIINDADWFFKVKNKKNFEKFLSVFNDEKVGGIAESFPVEFDKEKLEEGNLWYKMTAYVNFFWMDYMKKKFTFKQNDEILIIKKPAMFMTNIFRKKLYKKNFSLADDIERTYHIMEEGYKIVIFDTLETPRFISIYNKIKLNDIIKQKIRTAIARKQIKKTDINIKFYFGSSFYIIRKCFKSGIKIGFLSLIWIKIMVITSFISLFLKKDTKEGWKLRAER